MNADTCLEYFRQKKAKADNHVYHIIDVTEEQQKRIKNDGPKPKTRFQIELADEELYREWNFEKDRILARVKCKPIALDFMYRAWRDALADRELDRMLAEEGGAPE